VDQSGNGDRSPVLSPSQQAVDASGEVIFLTDRVGVITFVNPQFERLYGYSAQEVVGRTTPRILKSGYTVPATYHAMWQRLRCGESVRCEIINRTKDGRLVHIEGSANPIRDENQNIVGYLAIQRDVTARRAAEEALRESEARYRTLADAAHDHIFIIGHDGRFVYINPRGAALLDMTPQEVVGKRLDECMPPELAATVEKAGSNPCPPIIVGVGIGGTADHAMLLAKKALLREIGKPHPDARFAGLEGVCSRFIFSICSETAREAAGLAGALEVFTSGTPATLFEAAKTCMPA